MPTNIPLGVTSFVRSTSEEGNINLENRYFEQNPANQQDQVALLARPGFQKWLTVSASPVDNIYYQPGSFSDSLFVASAGSLYRVTTNEAISTLGSSIFNTAFGTNGKVMPKMAATASLGSTPEYLYIADGRNLWMYADANSATGILTSTGTIANNDVVQVGNVYYKWTTGSVNSGTPAGTFANPWLIVRGANSVISMTTLKKAINNTGVNGTDYSTALVANPDIYADNSTTVATTRVYARVLGAGGNSLATTVPVGALLSWGSATLTGGGTPSVVEIPVPDDAGPLDVAFIAGYIVVVIGEGYGVNGRFYWIEPGTTYIDPLNFATAERAPDPLYSIKVMGDQFLLFGTNTTEVWYPSGDFSTPFLRAQGRLFDRGIWPGTDIQIKDDTMLVDTDGVVYALAGSPVRVSDNSVEERIRRSFAYQKTNSVYMRAWGFSMDGHDFYILNLPDTTPTTLVFDITTKTWSTWMSPSHTALYQQTGLNWITAGSATYGRSSVVVVGDSRSGVLWLASSTLGYDENITTAVANAFACKVTGGIPMRNRDSLPCNAVYLTAALGRPNISGAGFTLRTSDDFGNTWIDHGTLAVTPSNYSQEFAWRSLGQIVAPGRIFEITDSGASIRIDSLDMK